MERPKLGIPNCFEPYWWKKITRNVEWPKLGVLNCESDCVTTAAAETAVAIAQWECCPTSLNIVAIAIAQWERTLTDDVVSNYSFIVTVDVGTLTEVHQLLFNKQYILDKEHKLHPKLTVLIHHIVSVMNNNAGSKVWFKNIGFKVLDLKLSIACKCNAGCDGFHITTTL